MSKKEFNRRKLSSMVFLRAWKYFRSKGTNSYSFSLCLKLAWKTARGIQHLIYSKVRGTTFSNENGVSRQIILYNLRKYSLSEVGLELVRDYVNLFDRNAVMIFATVRNRGSAVVGYLSAELASEVAPLLDSGLTPIVFFLGITGEDTLGLNFAFTVMPSLSTIYNHCKKKSPHMALPSLTE